jgi:hypothetical protein
MTSSSLASLMTWLFSAAGMPMLCGKCAFRFDGRLSATRLYPRTILHGPWRQPEPTKIEAGQPRAPFPVKSRGPSGKFPPPYFGCLRFDITGDCASSRRRHFPHQAPQSRALSPLRISPTCHNFDSWSAWRRTDDFAPLELNAPE